MRIFLDIRKSVEGNAADCFERAKKARRKLAGARAALERSEQKLQLADISRPARSLPAPARAREWYEKFRWFFSSDGFLCIGGRDAATNEIVIKKHTESGDIVFHAELAGSPFFVVKSGSKAIPASTITEVAVATGSYSRAWKAGLQSVEVYHVRPNQVSKEAKAGEFIGKGAFMIYGEKTHIPVTLELGIGMKDGKIMGGPLKAVSANCANFVKIIQGSDKTSDAAKKILKILKLDSSYLDEMIRALPAGEFKVLRV